MNCFDLHSTTCQKRQKNKHCARKKAQFFYYWLIHKQPSIRKDSTVCTPSEFVCKFIVYSCLTAENQLSVTLVKEEKVDSRGQTVLRKQQVVCTGAAIESFKDHLSLLGYFQLYQVYERENAKNESNPFTYTQAVSSSASASER